MASAGKDLWSLVLNQQYVDPAELADAMEEEARHEQLDFRTRLLLRDSLTALRHYWGPQRLGTWLAASPVRRQIEAIEQQDLGKPGFPFLPEQVMEPTQPDTVKQFFRELGNQLHQSQRLLVGGSIALIMPGYLSRRTQDVDVVDEVPAEIRALGKSLQDLMQRYRLQVAHFQSHYLPKGWEQRIHSLGPFGRLNVFLVDVYDVFLSKLFSAREKDHDDLRAVAPQLEKETLARRLRETAAPLLADPIFRQRAEHNWYVLYGEPLPS
jgi:hypothetical protein